MSEFLFVRPTFAEPQAYDWFSYDDVGKNVLSSGKISSLKELIAIKEDAPKRTLVVLYPISACSLKEINYPGRLKKANQNALLYAVEDDFAEDIENFSVHVLNHEGSKYNVLIYKTQDFKNLEEALKEMGFEVSFIIPDVFTLPVGTKVNKAYDLVTMKFEDTWLFRDGPFSGFTIDDGWLSFAKDSIDLEKGVTSLSEVPQAFKEMWNEELCESPFALIADGALKSKINLSSTHKKKSLQLKFLQSWVKVIVLVILLITVWELNMNYRIKALVQEANSYKNMQRQLFSEIMPNTGRVNDPVATMKQYISDTSAIGTDEGYIDLQNLISDRLTKQSDIELVSLTFERKKKTFVVQFLGPEVFDMERFKNSFGVDFQVTNRSAKPSRDKMLYNVILRRNK